MAGKNTNFITSLYIQVQFYLSVPYVNMCCILLYIYNRQNKIRDDVEGF